MTALETTNKKRSWHVVSVLAKIDVGLNKRGAQERLLISKLSREDLENKYLDAYENNIVLKKLALKQEDRIKK